MASRLTMFGEIPSAGSEVEMEARARAFTRAHTHTHTEQSTAVFFFSDGRKQANEGEPTTTSHRYVRFVETETLILKGRCGAANDKYNTVRETSLKRTHCSFLSQLQMKPAACA
jgi:hypothetical protein